MIRFLVCLMLLVGAGLPAAAGAADALAEGQTLKGRFVQERHLKGFKHPVRSEGTFILAPGKGLIWRTETPFAMTTVITPGGLVQDSGGAETLRMPADRMPFLSRFYAMIGGALSGDWSALEDQFRVSRTGTDDAWTLDLAPLKAESPAMPLAALAVAGGRFVDRVEMTKTAGDRDILSFRDQTLSTDPLSDADRALLDRVK